MSRPEEGFTFILFLLTRETVQSTCTWPPVTKFPFPQAHIKRIVEKIPSLLINGFYQLFIKKCLYYVRSLKRSVDLMVSVVLSVSLNSSVLNVKSFSSVYLFFVLVYLMYSYNHYSLFLFLFLFPFSLLLPSQPSCPTFKFSWLFLSGMTCILQTNFGTYSWIVPYKLFFFFQSRTHSHSRFLYHVKRKNSLSFFWCTDLILLPDPITVS